MFADCLRFRSGAGGISPWGQIQRADTYSGSTARDLAVAKGQAGAAQAIRAASCRPAGTRPDPGLKVFFRAERPSVTVAAFGGGMHCVRDGVDRRAGTPGSGNSTSAVSSAPAAATAVAQPQQQRQ